MTGSETETHLSRSLRETRRIGQTFARRLHRGDLVALVGDLGAGKTALTRGIASGLGLADERLVSSPSYVLVQEYPAEVPVFHVDLYRLHAPAEELLELGLEEMLSEGVVVIEWAARAEEVLPRPYWHVEARVAGESSREFTIRRVE